MLKKIGFKLTLGVGIITILIISVYAYVNIRSQNEVLLAEVERHANQLSETIKKGTRFDMLANRREHLYNIINTIGEEPSIQEIRVFNKLGEIIYSTREDDIGKMLDKKAESCYACHTADKPLERLSINERTRIYRQHADSARVLGIINPIYNESSCWEADCHAHPKEQAVLGVLDITMTLKDVDKQIKRSEINVVVFTLIAVIGISFIIGFFVKKWIGNPVKEMVKATQHIASGNLHYNIKSQRDDELGLLAKSFNVMTQKLAEARLQLFQSDKMASLGRLAAGVAHELNNPLTGVLTYSSFLLKRTEDNQGFQEDLKVIVREAKRSREIVKSLLDFARQSVPKKNKVDINQIIDHSIAVVENQLSINNIQVETKYNQDLPLVELDSNQLQQVFINLLVNASDAIGKEGGTIAVSTSLIRLSPVGILHIKEALCPKGHNLIDNDVKIAGKPSIKVKVNVNNTTKDVMFLDPVYGENRHHYDFHFKNNENIQFSCPVCDRSLIIENRKCPRCGSNIYSLEIPSQGNFEGCTNVSCDWQQWEEIDKAGKKDYLEIKVIDTGCGISQENVSKIFDPFYSTKGQKGTGLGLAVTWGIIDNHDGTIKVESEIGKGTAFTISLPVQQSRIS
jgi:two-component system NtrC family sensor kinase